MIPWEQLDKRERAVVTQELKAYELDVARDKSSYCYRPCLLSRVLCIGSRERWRSLKPSEMMIKVGQGCYLVTHACVAACHCPHCGADVGVLCSRKTRKLTTSTHYQRRDLYRSALSNDRRKNGTTRT